jgi:hypothetical protein
VNEEPKEVIVEVLSLSSANDWFFGDVGDELKDAEPVMCFALITAFNAKYPSLGTSKQLIGLSANDLSTDLLGSPVSQFRADVVHRKDLLTDDATT